MKRMIIALVLSLSALSLSGLTFLVDTHETMSLNDMETDRKIRVVSVESGVMDTLFDAGHIFFNMMTIPDEDGVTAGLEDSIELARNEGVDYLILLTPDDGGTSWALYHIARSSALDEGYVDFSGTDDTLDDRERWSQVGSIAASQMMARVPGN